jgi:hypothetical protein
LAGIRKIALGAGTDAERGAPRLLRGRRRG